MEVSIQAAGDSSSTTIEIVPPPRVDITIDRGVTGPQGPAGPQGAPGVGIPVGGSTGQVLAKTSGADYATGWTTGGTVTSVDVSGDATGLTFTGGPITSSGTITLGGTLAVASGGTGVATSNGANSVMLRDANANTSINALFSGYSNVAATGTVTTLTVASPYSWVVTGSGGQTYQLPNATTLPVGAIYTFNNNQSSGTILVRNNSATTVITVQSGSEATLTLLSNANAAGSWDGHYSTPSNASWSTNTLNWAGSYTNGTWNGNAVDILRGGTGASTASAAFNALSPITSTGDLIVGNGTNSATRLGVGTTGQVLTSTGTTATWSAANAGTVTSVSTTGTVNGITLTGGPITSSGTVTLGGTLDLSSPPAIGGTTPAAGSFTTLIGGADAANYIQTVGAATTLDPVTSAQGSDADVSLVFKTKGTGAIDLAAGSTGVNISNGGTVTLVSRTAVGSGYTTAPTWTASAPTTPGGTTASGTTTLALQGLPTITSGGTGYTAGDILTFVGGTVALGAATITVSTVSGGIITAVALGANGSYTAPPTNPISVTGGTGSGATFTTTLWGITSTIAISVAGSGYVEQPTITFSGSGGSGAAAYAIIGSTATIKSIGAPGAANGQSLNVNTPGGIVFSFLDAGTQTTTAYWAVRGSTSTPILAAYPSSLAAALIDNTTAGPISFRTNANVEFQINHTTSPVNYPTVTGGATGKNAFLSVAGSDTNVPLAISTKGTGAIDLAPGTGGVNISNGTTVTTVISTAAGSGYTTPPTWTASASNTSGGTTASGSVTNIGVVTATVSAGGSGYAVGNVLTISGGTSTVAATVTVATVSAGAVLTVTISNAGAYTAVPTNPAATTGGAGSGATFTLSFGINNAFTITQAGTGYVEQPTITFSGGGGTGAAAYAYVGSSTTQKTIGGTHTFTTPNSSVLAIVDKRIAAGSYPVNTTVAFSMLPQQNNFGISYFGFGAAAYLATTSTSATGAFTFATATTSPVSNGAAGTPQLTIVHTASAVNYIQATGAATTASPSISAAGSDANIDLTLTPKGSGNVKFGTYTAGILTQAGYVTITDSGGTVRRLLVG